MADPNIPPEEESKKDTVRINLPPSMAPSGAKPKPEEQAKRDTSAMGGEQGKKETAMMGMPSEPKKETSRVTVPSTKPVAPDMPSPTVRLRREPLPTTPSTAPAAPTAARAQVPEMPRPTVKLKVEEPVSAETAAPPPTLTPSPAPVVIQTGAGGFDITLSLLAAVSSVAVLAYLAWTVYK